MNLQAPSPGQTPLPEIRDIAPPVDVFPWPLWMVIVAGVLALAVVTAIVVAVVRTLSHRPPPPLPTPRAVALAELEDLRLEVEKLPPYQFSVRVSDVLRSYIAAEYKLKITKQTSPEFLESIAMAKEFSDSECELLAQFLEKADLIKFAHIDASIGDSKALLDRAFAFVQGARV